MCVWLGEYNVDKDQSNIRHDPAYREKGNEVETEERRWSLGEKGRVQTLSKV